MIRLRQSIEAGLRHPLLGPLLLVGLALILAFVVIHTVEHGVEGLLFTCAIIVVAGIRLVVVLGRTWRASSTRSPVVGRAPPRRGLSCAPALAVPAVPFALPLRL